MYHNNEEEIEIDLRELLQVLISRIWLILLAGIVFAGATGVICKFIMTPIYSSTTQLCILSNTTSIASLSDLAIGTQLTQDYIVVTQSRPVVEGVIKNLDLDMTYEELLSVTTVANPSDTRILTITVTNPDPYLAKQIVDQYAAISRHRIAELMDINEPGIIEEGHVAEKKTSPRTTRNAMVAGVIGVLLASALFIIRYLMDDTIKSSEDIERYLGLNTIGILPIDESGLREGQREALAKQAARKRRKRKSKSKSKSSKSSKTSQNGGKD